MARRKLGKVAATGLALWLLAWLAGMAPVSASHADVAAEKATVQQSVTQGVDQDTGQGRWGNALGREKSMMAPAVLCWELMNQELYVYNHNMKHLPWRDIRGQREMRTTAHENEKRLYAALKTIPWLTGDHFAIPSHGWGSMSVLLRDPDGKAQTMAPQNASDGMVRIPHEAEINGRYILSARLTLDNANRQYGPLGKTIHLYAKQFVTHHKSELPTGNRPEVFFYDPQRVALEIGPVVDNAKSKYGGSLQQPHHAYEMKVIYKNAPLKGSRLSVYVDGGGWQGQFVTDSRGIATIMPPDDRGGDTGWQRHIYVAQHHDQSDDSYHIATFPVIVIQNRPEWRSVAMGFVYWSIFGGSLLLLLVVGLWRHKQQQEKRNLVEFEKCQIKKE